METKICPMCGQSFDAHRKEHTYCCKSCAAKAIYKKGKKSYKFSKNDGIEDIIKSVIKPKKQPCSKEHWKAMTPSERFKLMTWKEVSAECARFHISYGKAQVMAQNQALPDDFGKIRK